MSVKKPGLIKPFAWIAGAALAGVLAGTVAVYVNNSSDANQTVATAAGQTGNRDDSSCKIDGSKKASLVQALRGDVAGMIAATEGFQTAGLAFTKPDGTLATMADQRGKVILLNLWATWCVPCRAEMPSLDKLQAETGSADFEVVAVNVESNADAKRKAFLADAGIKAMVDYSDPDLGLFNELKKQGLILGLPFTMLIGKDGCMLSFMNGPAEWASADAKRLIEAAKGL